MLQKYLPHILMVNHSFGIADSYIENNAQKGTNFACQNTGVNSSAQRTPLHVPVVLSGDSHIPLPTRLANSLRANIDAGLLRPGEPLPASRKLAEQLGLSRGVVVAAYEQLLAEGYLEARQGSGTFVHHAAGPQSKTAQASEEGDPSTASQQVQPETSQKPVEREPYTDPCVGVLTPKQGLVPSQSAGLAAHFVPASAANLPGEPPRQPLAPGTPPTDVTERAAWRRAWRWAAMECPEKMPPQGSPALRQELAEHLRLVRGTTRAPQDVLVTAGAREGLGLLLTAMGVKKGRPLRVGVENPGFPSLRSVCRRLGAEVVPLRVDREGLCTTELPQSGLDAVLVTPSHQYPVGGSLPLRRRRELLEWAAKAEVLLIEDDYDSELRHAGSPLPTLAALDNPQHGYVVTLGTFSSTVSPALQAGFLLAPQNVRECLEPVREDLGCPVSPVTQVALSEYLASGELRRNIARVRRRHAARRDLLSDRIAGVPLTRVRPMSGGLHAVIEFQGQQAVERERVVTSYAKSTKKYPQGVGIAALGDYWQATDAALRTAGIVLGMGGPSDSEFAEAVETLRCILLHVQP